MFLREDVDFEFFSPHIRIVVDWQDIPYKLNFKALYLT